MIGTHLVNHIKRPTLASDNTLHVAAVCSNIPRWHSRYRIAREFIAAMEATANVKLYLVEAVFGDRQPELEGLLSDPSRYKAVKIWSHIWSKEALINTCVNQLFPNNWRYGAHIDMDVFWRDPNWAAETLHQLQEFSIIQPWSQCVDLGPQGNIMQTHQSFGLLHQKGVAKQKRHDDPYAFGHSGYAWCWSRKFWENLPGKGLMDFCGTGQADWLQSWACIGEADSVLYPYLAPSYRRKVLEWQAGALKTSQHQVGFINTRIEHMFHGSKKNRFYKTRDQLLAEFNFDPDKDLAYDENGIVYLVNKPGLEHAFRKHSLSRQEDNIDE